MTTITIADLVEAAIDRLMADPVSQLFLEQWDDLTEKLARVIAPRISDSDDPYDDDPFTAMEHARVMVDYHLPPQTEEEAELLDRIADLKARMRSRIEYCRGRDN